MAIQLHATGKSASAQSAREARTPREKLSAAKRSAIAVHPVSTWCQ